MIDLKSSCKLCKDRETCTLKRKVDMFDFLMENNAYVKDGEFEHPLHAYSPFQKKRGLELSLKCKWCRRE